MSSIKRTLEFNGNEELRLFTKKQKLVDQEQPHAIKTGMLSPPITPENDRIITISHDSLTPKKLALLETPPATPVKRRPLLPLNTPLNNSSIYSHAKKLFHRASHVDVNTSTLSLPCRESEAAKLHDFVLEKVKTLTPGSLYISGPPGTGKTAQTTATMNNFFSKYGSQDEISNTFHKLTIGNETRRVAYIQLNCMVVQKAEHVYDEVGKKLSQKQQHKKFTSKDLKEMLIDQSKADISIIVLDELDNLITSNQQILFELFSYASRVNNEDNGPRLILIGIANALDLTDRFLPRLRTNRINPALLPFLPYDAPQIKQVIEAKLKSIPGTRDSVQFIHPAAIQLCAKKTASNTGDLRKALDICYRSLELAEENIRNKLSPEEFDSLTIETAPKVSIANVAKICSAMFSSSTLGNDASARLKMLNLQQKTLLCSLYKFESVAAVGKSKTINEFYDFYRTKIKLDNLIGLLRRSEFMEVITTLQSLGMVNTTTGMFKKNGELGSTKISGNIKKEDLLKAVEDVRLLKNYIL